MSDYRLPPWIPEDVADALKACSEAGWQGKLEIHYNDGHPHEIAATRRRKVKRPAAAPTAPRCPECGRPMESRDYSNTFVCACGVKRTKAQLATTG